MENNENNSNAYDCGYSVVIAFNDIDKSCKVNSG